PGGAATRGPRAPRRRPRRAGGPPPHPPPQAARRRPRAPAPDELTVHTPDLDDVFFALTGDAVIPGQAKETAR
ncbi:hypothetical protein ACFXDP_24455, partial [Streptomyces sp. NPDC059374]